MAHREGIREYLKDVQVNGKVIDWGCGTKPIMNYLKNADKVTFTNVDKTKYEQVDMVADLEDKIDLPFKDYDFAFCLEVIEHTWNVMRVLHNIRLHLKMGGVLYLSVPFLYPVHKEDDYQRFTHHGLKRLLETVDFKVLDIQPTVGDLDHAEGYIVKAVK